MKIREETLYDQITRGDTIWEVDGRGERPDQLTYRESLHANYQGPYTKGEPLKWDGLVGNNPGMIGNDPVNGFDLTMPAGQATDEGYTTRDMASAPHGVDYSPHFDEWEHDTTRHPNLIMPGRTLRYHNVRMGCLALGDELLGTGGCITQDWLGLDFATMEKHGADEERYIGGGFMWLPPASRLGSTAIRMGKLRRSWPFQTQIPGAAPVLVMYAKLKGWVTAGTVWLDPSEPHEFTTHWTPDGQAIELWADRHRVTRIQQGKMALPMGLKTKGRIEFNRSGAHACCWQDNNNGGTYVSGYPGNPVDDQPFTIERFEIIQS